ncbi:MAG: hypothetical protein WC509_05600 [Candidatus Izemoplasmatales bacterium]
MKNPIITKVLAILGTVLALFPIAFMLFTSVVGSIDEGRFLMDYMFPAELGFVVAVGAVVLLWSAWTSPHDRMRVLIAGGAAILFFLLVLVVAAATGLDEDPDPSGFLLGLVTALLVLYDLATAAIGVAGVLYLRKLFRKSIT